MKKDSFHIHQGFFFSFLYWRKHRKMVPEELRELDYLRQKRLGFIIVQFKKEPNTQQVKW